MKLTDGQIKDLLHGNQNWDDWVKPMQKLLPQYEINTPARIAGFIAQCGHESLNFTVLEENLNYSAKGLNTIFPKYFKNAGRDAEKYHRKPQDIANVVYANRMKNGDTESNDGWKFRGRGVIQLTGRSNVTRFANDMNMAISEAIEYLETKMGALHSACWYWDSRNINRSADDGDIVTMTKLVNGGTIGLEDRRHHYIRAIEILDGTYVPKPTRILLKVGSTGSEVKSVQKALGLDADGHFGLVTKSKVMEWQESNGLTVDGIVGNKTYYKLIG
jgi:putative chitinase